MENNPFKSLDWSPTAVDVATKRYLRQRGLGPTGKAGEADIPQMLQRVTRSIAQAGQWLGYLTSDGAQAFASELFELLAEQRASFNSPVYFNVGIFSEYGILGLGESYFYDREGKKVTSSTSVYLHPQASACFIQDVQDSLISIFDLLKSEAKLFKYGSGTGTNFSRLRAKGEPLDGGGESTGLISYLEIFDKAAHAIKSGGTTRRAAKMVVVDADHPEIREFVQWKMMEERKARLLLANGFSGGMEGEAFQSVSGQNSNNSVRVSDEFLKRVVQGELWQLHARKSGAVVAEFPAQELFKMMAKAAWECADPGLQFADTINKWHMCPRSGEIRSSNPCSEYLFLDNSACNLASLNLVKFLKDDGQGFERFDWQSFEQTVGSILFGQEILVDFASYPTAEIAENSHRFRPLGLGYANLGGLLMRLGIPYESAEALAWTKRITAAMHALALKTSISMAEKWGAFDGWNENRVEALSVLNQHRQAWKESGEEWSWLSKIFDDVMVGAEKFGLRNAQVTLLAPTGTIGLVMDCDTLGIEPDFSLVKRKTLAGGGEFILTNTSVQKALQRLGYASGAINEIVEHVKSHGTVVGAPGFKNEHAAVFDCALAPKGHPERRVSAHGHLNIMAAAQPFLSGGISKTVNLPSTTTVEEIEELFMSAWRLGLKSVAIYRDGSKALQPLCAEC